MEFCEGVETGDIIFGIQNADSVHWTSSNPAIGVNHGTGDVISSFEPNNPLNQPISSTITITAYFNGCEDVASEFVITVKPKPIATGSFNKSYCSNVIASQVPISNAPLGATNMWINNNLAIGDLPAMGTGNIPTFLTATTNTILTGSVSIVPEFNGCFGDTATHTITINPRPEAPLVSADRYSACENGTAQLYAEGGYIYSWHVALGSNGTITGSVFCNDEYGIFTPCDTVTAVMGGEKTTFGAFTTDANGCFSDVTLITIDAYRCDPCTDCNLDLSGTIIIPTIPTSNRTYCVNNNLTIGNGANITFTNCRFKIAGDVKFIVKSGATLTLSACHLLACDAMWQGIVVEKGGKLIVKADGPLVTSKTSLIEHAYVAVDVKALPTAVPNPTTNKVIDISRTAFNRNEIGIRINGYEHDGASPFSVVNCLFTSRALPHSETTLNWQQMLTLMARTTPISNPMISPYRVGSWPLESLKYPRELGTKPIAGIQLINVGKSTILNDILSGGFSADYSEITLGSAAITLNPNFNLFDNLHVGINALNSNLKVVNSVFQNMYTPNVRGGDAGIRASSNSASKNNRLQVVPAVGTTSTNQFFDCYYGIVTSNYLEHNIKYTDMRSTQVYNPNLRPTLGLDAIHIETNRFLNVDIQQNTITNISNGVVFIATSGPLAIPGLNATGGQLSMQMNIDYNTFQKKIPYQLGPISTQFLGTAISISSPLGLGQMYNPAGINATISTSHNIITEVFRGITFNNIKQRKMVTAENEITLVSEGLPSLATPQFGIRTEICGGLPHSIYHNNISGPSSGDYVASYNPNFAGIISSTSRGIVVECNTMSQLSHGIQFAGSHLATKFIRNTINNSHCYGFVLSNNGVIGPQGSQGLQGLPSDNLWKGSWTGGKFKTATIGATAVSSNLYIRTNNTDANPNGSGYTDISQGGVNNQTNYYIGSLNSGTLKTVTNPNPSNFYGCPSSGPGTGGEDSLTIVISGLTPIVQGLIPFIQNPLESDYIAKNEVYQNLIQQPILRESSAILQQFFNEYENGMSKKFADVELSLSIGDLSIAASLIAEIDPQTGIEANYKQFYILHNSYLNSTFSEIENSELLGLALGCPFTDGSVVYQARALYNLVNSENRVFKDDCSTSGAKNMSISNRQNEYGFDVAVYPNPTNGIVELKVADNDIEQLQISVVDINGKEVVAKELNLENGIVRLNLDVANGLYLLKIGTDSGEQLIKRIIVNK